MTEDERRSDAEDKLIEFADNERDIHCLRERLRTAWKIFDRLQVRANPYPDLARAEKAVRMIDKVKRDPRIDVQEYVEALRRRAQLAQALEAFGYGAVVKNN